MSEFHTKPNPDQPDRCPSIDPHDELQCTRRIHEDDQCVCGGIGWKKGTPRYVSDRELVEQIRDLHVAIDGICAACIKPAPCPTIRLLYPAPPVTVPEPEGGDEG